ncbi:MAG: disulfide bond formation protein B [Dehalococcoidia bacterium]|nr:disulfide bond formation protein B [Dehalococcoidia bacterium]MCB9485016.1 disulfide bond formation protein B [Thermoflexaceae bacterium]
MESEQYVSPLLAMGSIVIVFATLIAMMVAELDFADPLRRVIDQHAQKLMLIPAMAAMLGSLYYSEIVGFIPCEFCWFQRIAMYPLASLLLVAVVTRGRLDSRYVVPLALGGLGLSIYHYQLQLFPEQSGVCSGLVHCTDKNVEEFGFISIPWMAGSCFLTVLLLQLAEWRVDYLYRRWAGEGDSSPI